MNEAENDPETLQYQSKSDYRIIWHVCSLRHVFSGWL